MSSVSAIPSVNHIAAARAISADFRQSAAAFGLYQPILYPSQLPPRPSTFYWWSDGNSFHIVYNLSIFNFHPLLHHKSRSVGLIRSSHNPTSPAICQLLRNNYRGINNAGILVGCFRLSLEETSISLSIVVNYTKLSKSLLNIFSIF